MTACSVMNCTYRTEHGFRMYRLPTDEQRRKVWERFCKKPTKDSTRLCEFHFDESQFEVGRRDGWLRLKSNAVPTIFRDEFGESIVYAYNDLIGYRLSTQELCREIKKDHTYSRSPHMEAETQTEEDATTGHQVMEERLNRQHHEIKNLTLQLEKVRSKFNIILSKYQNEKKLRIDSENQLESCRSDMQKFNRLMKKVEEIPFLRDYSWRLSSPKVTWPRDSLELAIEIKDAVGWKKYLFLREKLNIPLPSYATICRHLADSSMDINPKRTCFIKEEIMIDEDFPLDDSVEQNLDN